MVFSPTGSAISYWIAAKTEDSLAKESDVIVYAQYLGESAIKIVDKEFHMNLGILSQTQVLKGKVPSALIFIKRYNTDVPLSSDMLFLQWGNQVCGF